MVGTDPVSCTIVPCLAFIPSVPFPENVLCVRGACLPSPTGILVSFVHLALSWESHAVPGTSERNALHRGAVVSNARRWKSKRDEARPWRDLYASGASETSETSRRRCLQLLFHHRLKPDRLHKLGLVFANNSAGIIFFISGA